MWSFDTEVLRRGKRAILHDVQLRVNPGDRIALLGVSGSGKSTLLEALRAQFDDSTSWCPQNGALVPMFSVFHNIYMGQLADHSAWTNLRNLIKPSQTALAEVGALADQLGLGHLLGTSVDRLSGGQAQRTALGRALFRHRPLLLADEPVSSLDPHQAVRVLELALSRHEAAVVALHDRQLALQCFTRVIGLRDHHVVLDASTDQLARADLDRLYTP